MVSGLKKYKNISQICMHFKQENPSLHDLLIWIMQIWYSELNPPVKNIKGEKTIQKTERSEKHTLASNIIIIFIIS